MGMIASVFYYAWITECVRMCDWAWWHGCVRKFALGVVKGSSKGLFVSPFLFVSIYPVGRFSVPSKPVVQLPPAWCVHAVETFLGVFSVAGVLCTYSSAGIPNDRKQFRNSLKRKQFSFSVLCKSCKGKSLLLVFLFVHFFRFCLKTKLTMWDLFHYFYSNIHLLTFCWAPVFCTNKFISWVL